MREYDCRLLERSFLKMSDDLTVENVVTQQWDFENLILSELFLLLIKRSIDLIVKCSSIIRINDSKTDIVASEFTSKADMFCVC